MRNRQFRKSDFERIVKARRLDDDFGQSTVEYAVVAAAMLAIVVGLGALADFLREGVILQHAAQAASHNPSASPGGVVDVFCY